MGFRYRYVCPACGYAVSVAGGDDYGFMGTTTTIACVECRRLYDVQIFNMGPCKMLPDADLKMKPPACPRSRKHSVRKWSHPGPCPNCGKIMEREERTSFWD
ncbi:MAG: hypothetical protein ABFD98_19430 [Syntrophobacteraceae bacterium]